MLSTSSTQHLMAGSADGPSLGYTISAEVFVSLFRICQARVPSMMESCHSGEASSFYAWRLGFTERREICTYVACSTVRVRGVSFAPMHPLSGVYAGVINSTQHSSNVRE